MIDHKIFGYAMVKKTLVSISFLSRILSMEGNNIGKKHIVGIFELGAAILYTISLSLFFYLPASLRSHSRNLQLHLWYFSRFTLLHECLSTSNPHKYYIWINSIQPKRCLLHSNSTTPTPFSQTLRLDIVKEINLFLWFVKVCMDWILKGDQWRAYRNKPIHTHTRWLVR